MGIALNHFYRNKGTLYRKWTLSNWIIHASMLKADASLVPGQAEDYARVDCCIGNPKHVEENLFAWWTEWMSCSCDELNYWLLSLSQQVGLGPSPLLILLRCKMRSWSWRRRWTLSLVSVISREHSGGGWKWRWGRRTSTLRISWAPDISQWGCEWVRGWGECECGSYGHIHARVL